MGSPGIIISRKNGFVSILGSEQPLCDYTLMDYYKFLDEYQSYNEWNQLHKKEDESWESFKEREHPYGSEEDYIVERQLTKLQGKHEKDDRWLKLGEQKDDRVNSPSHYTSGKVEVIEVIEDAIKDAPSTVFGMLQGQVLKYILRVWLKDNPIEDMKKARWYLDRMITHYEEYPGDNPPPFSLAPFKK